MLQDLQFHSVALSWGKPLLLIFYLSLLFVVCSCHVQIQQNLAWMPKPCAVSIKYFSSFPRKKRLFSTRPSMEKDANPPILGRSRAAGRCIERGDMIAEAAWKRHGNPRKKSCTVVVSIHVFQEENRGARQSWGMRRHEKSCKNPQNPKSIFWL